ncbi:MAG: hypothetical protein H6915_08680 [Novosphingobium sp.]|nr:hypothetical protein [Novosphingobium sp.]
MITRQTPRISPETILSGIGHADRELVATYLALFAAGEGLALMKGALKGLGTKLKLREDDTAAEMKARVQAIVLSKATNDELRHQLWLTLTESLVVKSPTPFSRRSGRMSASALAVRASERLSPAIRATWKLEEKKRKQAPVDLDTLWAEKLGARAADMALGLKKRLLGDEPLPFPVIVQEEILSLLKDPEVMARAARDAAAQDPKMADAMEKAHRAAQAAIATGGGWTMFAAIVANAGFAPYILAAQASAWIPLVGGKTLVSLLAVLVSPVTLFAGVAVLAWLGTAKTGATVRSAIAARICVLLALAGTENAEAGTAKFLDSMRSLTRSPETMMAHLSTSERRDFRNQAAFITRYLGKSLEKTAGVPPAPWHQRRLPKAAKTDLDDALLAGALTAGEMYWHAAAINPDVIAAADFCRIEDLGDPISFAVNAQMFAADAAGYSLRGYTAERLVMDRLVEDGHAVSLAPDSNTAGLDLIVDGSPVQVKCAREISNLTEHFEKYPDIPVIANAELAQEAWERGEDWADLVSTVAGFDLAGIEADISEALGHAASVLDPGVVELALELGVLRGGIEAWRGRIPPADLPVWMAMNAGAKGVLAFTGGQVGWLAGLVVAGPAGAVIFGPAVACAALIGATPIQGAATRILLRDWHAELITLTAELHADLRLATENRIRGLVKRSDTVRARTAGDTSEFGPWLNRRSDDDLVAAIEDLAGLESPRRAEKDVPTLIATSALLAPGSKAVSQARKRLERHLMERPRLVDAVGDKATDWARRAGTLSFVKNR